MMISAVVQYYVHLRMSLDKVEFTAELAGSVIERVKQMYPSIKVADGIQYKLKKEDFTYLDNVIEDQTKIKQIFNTLSKEHARVEKTFKPYDKDNIYQFNEFTINLNDYLSVAASKGDKNDTEGSKSYLVTVGVGFNFLTKEFLPPVVITNFKPSHLHMLKKNAFFFVNGSGHMSSYIFQKYSEWLNKKFLQELKKVLLITDMSCTHYIPTNFPNIKVYYNHMNNFPYNYGIGNSIISSISLQITNYLCTTKKKKHLVHNLPSVVITSLNSIIHNFTTPSNYNLFLNHCVDLATSDNVSTSVSKMLKANINLQHIHYSSTHKCLVLNSQEEHTKAWMSKIRTPSKQQDNSQAESTRDELEYVIHSNMILHNCNFSIKRNKPEDASAIELDKLVKLRSKLSSKVSQQTLSLYDQLFVSVAQDVSCVPNESHTWKPFPKLQKPEEDYDSEYEFEFEATNPSASGANMTAYHNYKIKNNNLIEIEPNNKPEIKHSRAGSISDIENILEGIKEQVTQELTQLTQFQTAPQSLQAAPQPLQTPVRASLSNQLVAPSTSHIPVINRAQLSQDFNCIQTSQVKQVFSDSEDDLHDTEYMDSDHSIDW